MSEDSCRGAEAPSLGKRGSAEDVTPRTEVDSPPRKKKHKTNSSSRALANPPAINQRYLEEDFKGSFGTALRNNAETSDSGSGKNLIRIIN